MKCPIKSLESDCIGAECPLYWQGNNECGISVAIDAAGDIADNLADVAAAMEGSDT